MDEIFWWKESKKKKKTKVVRKTWVLRKGTSYVFYKGVIRSVELATSVQYGYFGMVGGNKENDLSVDTHDNK